MCTRYSEWQRVIHPVSHVSFKSGSSICIGAGDVSGIGAATAVHMALFGPKFVLSGRKQETLDEVGKLMETVGVTRENVSLLYFNVKI